MTPDQDKEFDEKLDLSFKVLGSELQNTKQLKIQIKSDVNLLLEQQRESFREKIEELKKSRILSIEGNHASKRMTQGYHKAIRNVLALLTNNK